MTPELWKRLRPFYEEGSELSPEERVPYAEKVCRNDETLKGELLSMFRADLRGDGPLDFPIHTLLLTHPVQRLFVPGDCIAGRFDVVRHLGSGGMGDVYEACDLELGGELIALKTLRREISDDPAMLARFREEVKIARSVTGPHVCRIHELFVVSQPGFDQVAFLTMELLQGETLAARLRAQQHLLYEDILTIADQLATALGCIHRVGVVHRDLKPENIMLVPEFSGLRVVLMDFGVAHTQRPTVEGTVRFSESGAAIGTPGYMAPEQREGAVPTPASDIYALGMVIGQMLQRDSSHDRPTGDAPGNAKNAHDLKTSSAIRALLRRCTDPDPAKRYQTMEPLSRILRKELVITRSPLRHFSILRTVSGILLFAVPAIAMHERESFQGLLRASGEKHIVVLPWQFQPNANENDTSLAIGLSESVSETLKDVTVRDPSTWILTPNEALARNVHDTLSSKREFGATMAVSGSLRRIGGNIILNAAVDNLATGKRVGQFILTAPANDLERLLEQSVRHVTRLTRLSTSSLSISLLKRATPANNSYEAYLAGSGLFKRFDQPENLDLAISQLRKSIASDPNFAPAYTRLAEAILLKYRMTLDGTWLRQAEHLATSAIALDSQLTSAFTVLGQVHAISGENELAIHEFRHAMELDGQATGALSGLADVYRRTGRIRDAEDALRRASLIRSSDWAGHNVLGNFYEHYGRIDDAVVEYKKALALTPDNPAIYSNLSIAYMDLGTLPGLSMAATMLEKAASLGASDAVYTNLGFLLILERRYQDAIAACQRAVTLNPDNPDAWGNLAAAERWTGDEKKERAALEQATRLLQSKVETNSQNAQAQATLATYQARLGFRPRATESLQIALALAPDEPYALAQAASAYSVLGDQTRARRLVKKAVANGYPRMLLAEDPYLQQAAKSFLSSNLKHD
jgi:serine/threonine protein kinase/Flp pilus assembly protein TadD